MAYYFNFCFPLKCLLSYDHNDTTTDKKKRKENFVHFNYKIEKKVWLHRSTAEVPRVHWLYQLSLWISPMIEKFWRFVILIMKANTFSNVVKATTERMSSMFFYNQVLRLKIEEILGLLWWTMSFVYYLTKRLIYLKLLSQ